MVTKRIDRLASRSRVRDSKENECNDVRLVNLTAKAKLM